MQEQFRKKRGVETPFTRVRDRVFRYGEAFHQMYRDKASPVDELLKRRGLGSTIQFSKDIDEPGRVAVIALDAQFLPPRKALRINKPPRAIKPSEWELGCRQAVVATIPVDDQERYRRRYIGLSLPFTVGPRFTELPRFNNTTDCAIGLQFDSLGNVTEVLFQGTVTHGKGSITYVEPIQFSLSSKDRTIAVFETIRTRRILRDSPDAMGHLGIPVDEEIELILNKLPLNV